MGAPIKDVIIPMGISAGASNNLAAMSASVKIMDPINRAVGNKYLWLLPTNNRAI